MTEKQFWEHAVYLANLQLIVIVSLFIIAIIIVICIPYIYKDKG